VAKTKWAVDLIEHERGWGSKVDETRVFNDYDKACHFVTEFNSKNNLPEVPDWYMHAEPPRPVKS
jgi:D-serine dehydratase